MIKVAIFASGTGSNFEAIADHPILRQKMEIVSLVCDRPQAAVIDKAHQRNIPCYVFNPKNFDTKQQYERQILQHVEQCDFIFLAGYMRIISSYFLANFSGDIINLHPSLLPKYKGKDAIKQGFDNGDEVLGISIHYVNEELDGGEVIAQKQLMVLPEDTLDTVTDKIHQLEHQLYPQVIQQLIEEKGHIT